MNTVEPFCGAGGMALGLRAAGFDCLFACDLNPDAVKTVRQVVPLAEVVGRAIMAALEDE